MYRVHVDLCDLCGVCIYMHVYTCMYTQPRTSSIWGISVSACCLSSGNWCFEQPALKTFSGAFMGIECCWLYRHKHIYLLHVRAAVLYYTCMSKSPVGLMEVVHNNETTLVGERATRAPCILVWENLQLRAVIYMCRMYSRVLAFFILWLKLPGFKVHTYPYMQLHMQLYFS